MPSLVQFGSKFTRENPNMKMLIDDGWRQSNVIRPLGH